MTLTTEMLAKMTDAEVKDIYYKALNELNIRRDIKNIRAKQSLEVGKQVYFVTRRGERVEGVITKILKVNVKVRTERGVTWTVSPSLLKSLS